MKHHHFLPLLLFLFHTWIPLSTQSASSSLSYKSNGADWNTGVCLTGTA